jgi:hypothetical protein
VGRVDRPVGGHRHLPGRRRGERGGGHRRLVDDPLVAHHGSARLRPVESRLRVRDRAAQRGPRRRRRGAAAGRGAQPSRPRRSQHRPRDHHGRRGAQARRDEQLLPVGGPLPRDGDRRRRPHGRAHVERAAQGPRGAAAAHRVDPVRPERGRPAAHHPVARAFGAPAHPLGRRRRRAHRPSRRGRPAHGHSRRPGGPEPHRHGASARHERGGALATRGDPGDSPRHPLGVRRDARGHPPAPSPRSATPRSARERCGRSASSRAARSRPRCAPS